jgi:hypothetical protein
MRWAIVMLVAAACRSEAGDDVVAPETRSTFEREALDPIDPPLLPVDPPTPPVPPRELMVLVNTADTVFRVDPETLAITELGKFVFVDTARVPITDMALDRRGRLWGVSFDGVYAIDPATFETRLLAEVPPFTNLNALGIVASEILDRVESPDVLLAAGAYHDRVYEVNPATGAIVQRGIMGGGLESSGDITYAPGVGVVILAKDRGSGTEGIARLERGSLHAVRAPGGIGFTDVVGIAPFAKGRLFGVTQLGDVIVIDPVTGAAFQHASHDLVFFGAAVGWAPS